MNAFLWIEVSRPTSVHRKREVPIFCYKNKLISLNSSNNAVSSLALS